MLLYQRPGKLLSFGGEFRKIFMGGLTKIKGLSALLIGIAFQNLFRLFSGTGLAAVHQYLFNKSDIKSIKVRLGAIKKKKNPVLKYLKNNVAVLLKIGLDINVYGGLSFMAH